MDTYKQSAEFEKLAVKILEEYLNTSIDYNKTKITQKTRDYGIDCFVFVKDEALAIFRTIEAKLRSSHYTLALKDIATSVIFFILRHGDEHYIITNVYLTTGTKDVIKSVSYNTNGKIHYIDGETTKCILESILPNLKNDELKLAKEIINEFPNLKKPKQLKTDNSIKVTNSIQLYDSRKCCLYKASYELSKKTFVSLSGAFGTGKHLIARNVIERFKRNDYIIININALSNNLLSNFCYEITKCLFGYEINDLISIVKEDDESVYEYLNDVEINNLNILYKIFDANCMIDESSLYLAKQYLLNLFKSFNKNYYLIVVDNFDSVSTELFNLISQISTEKNINFKFFALTTTSSENYINFFTFKFKKIHYKTFKEIEINELSESESIKHITSINSSISEKYAKKLYSYIGGNPNLIEEFLETNKKVLPVLKANYKFTDSNTYYGLEINTKLENDDVLYLFFLITTFEKVTLEEIKKFVHKDNLEAFLNYVSNSSLFFNKNNIFSFKSNYIKDIVENKLFEFKPQIKLLTETYNYIPKFSDSLNQIIFYYYCDNDKIINVYNQTKEYWNHKNNIQWKAKALGYVCCFLKDNISNIKSVINFCEYSNLYTDCFEYTNDIKNQEITKKLDELISCLENYFTECENNQKQQVACILFDYKVKKSQDLNKSSSASLLFKIEKKFWFNFIDEYRKIKFIRLKALAFKSIGNKEEFYVQIEKLSKYSTPYAQFSYYANKAAQYYCCNPRHAYELLSKCPYKKYDNTDLQKLQLWIENDMSVVLFYLNNLDCSRRSAEVVLQKSSVLSYEENIARSYNIIALNELKKKDLKSAIENFYNAIVYSLYCTNDSILHFSVNYLNLSYNKEIESICLNYYKTNNESLMKILKSKKSSKRLLISLIAFLEVLKKHNNIKYNELYALYSSFVEKFEEDGTEIKINGKLFVLF